MADEPIVDEADVQDSEPDEAVEDAQSGNEQDGFDGDFDAPRARKLIDKLRGENADLKKQKSAPQPDPESDKLRVENLQLKVALELGIPEKLASRLQGSTREELIEDAADLMDTVSPRKQEEPKSQQPRPRLKGGSQPTVEPELSATDIAKGLRV